jgi:4-hydroxybenzoate polyprenyltransferase
MGAFQRLLAYGRMIRFSHSVFALPFALTAVVLAAGRDVPWATLGWIVVAMVGARSAAMGFNRLVDQQYDARNPRTAGRELPRGVLRRAEVWAFVAASAAALVLAAGMLNPLCLVLSPVALAVVFGYSYTKRFTDLSHLVLGLALAIAPVGAWLAVRGRFEAPPLLLALAVLTWVAGFDVIYACQDVAFDRASGLRSLPARVGVARALRVSAGLHALSVASLGAIYLVSALHPLYLLGVAGVAALLVYEHSLVTPGDLSRVNAAFFTVNGWISLGYFAVTVAARVLAGRGPL